MVRFFMKEVSHMLLCLMPFVWLMLFDLLIYIENTCSEFQAPSLDEGSSQCRIIGDEMILIASVCGYSQYNKLFLEETSQ